MAANPGANHYLLCLNNYSFLTGLILILAFQSIPHAVARDL